MAFAAVGLVAYLTWQQLRDTREQLALESRRANELQRRLSAPQKPPETLASAVLYRFEQLRGSAPPLRVLLPVSTQPIVLLIPLAPEPGAKGYRLRVQPAGGGAALTLDNAMIDSSGRLVVVFPSNLLQPGDYQLRVDVQDARGEFAEISSFNFRATAAP